MWLCIDNGNTNLKGALIHQGIIYKNQVLIIPNQDPNTHKKLTELISAQSQTIRGIGLVNVGSPTILGLLTNLAQQFTLPFFELTSGSKQTHIHHIYQDTHTLGADRFALMFFAHKKFPAHTVAICSLGTAFTFDVVLPSGQHAGGCIVPGIRLMRESLFYGTNKLPIVSHENPIPLQFLGTSTQTCIEYGTLHSFYATLEYFLRKWHNEYTSVHKAVIFAGLSLQFFQPQLEFLQIPKSHVVHSPHAVLFGLQQYLDTLSSHNE